MKYLFIAAGLLLAGCGGSLSDEQRKNLKEQMELHEIRRVTEAEITEAAFARGRKIMATIANLEADSVRIDSFIREKKGRIKLIEPGNTKTALALEQQLIDAYIAAGSGSLQDNVQDVKNADGDSDSILYTKPVVKKLDDGTEKLEGVWNIWLSKKDLILSMDKKK